MKARTICTDTGFLFPLFFPAFLKISRHVKFLIFHSSFGTLQGFLFLIHLNIRPDSKSLCFLVIFKNMAADFKNVVFWVTDLKETSMDVGVVVAVLVVAHNLDRLLCNCVPVP